MTLDQAALSAALPDYSAPVHVAGIDATVEIVRDQLGVPHIRAGSVADAFFGQGFAHAQDRLWQMEYDRQRAAGRWAEWAGLAWVDQDKLMRRLNLTGSAKADYAAFDPETKAMFDAYAAGVNAFISTTEQLPVEYGLVGAKPELWQPWDGCAVYKVRHVLMGTFGSKLWRARLLESVGPEMMMTLRTGSDATTPVIVVPGTEYTPKAATLDSMPLAEIMSGEWDWAAGSNNWVLAGTRTASGQPLLAGDPHRALEVPNVYYQNHVACPDFDVIGYSFAGLPAFPHFGHNADVAWCITHAMADYHDLFIEKFDPNDETRYEFRGAWRTAACTDETIAVRGGESVTIRCTTTHHGPIVVGDPTTGYALALRYTAIAEPDAGFTALLPMLKATNVEEFEATMPAWVDPANNLLFADRHGGVRYLMRGQVPQRTQANGWLPVPGWTGEHEWAAPIPFSALPRVRDPQTGYIVTANNRIVEDTYPYYVAIDWAPRFRAQRIEDRLHTIQNATVADMAAIHADRLSLPSRTLVSRLPALKLHDARQEAARTLLQEWDGQMLPDQVGPTLYAVWREQICAVLVEQGPLQVLAQFAPASEPVALRMLSLGSRLRNPVLALLAADEQSVLPTGQTWDDLLTEAFSRTVDWLTERLGAEMSAWEWGNLHQTAPKHTLAGTFPEAAAVLNPPAVPAGGDGDTPQAAAYAGLQGVGFSLTNTSVTRYCFDLADWDQSGWVVPLGASGHPGSPHYADQVAAWRDVQLLPMLYSWEKVLAAAESHQTLHPA